MRTAKTIQLLDANNNNVSPAVCIDSLYFELPSNNGNMYRMSLRNRTLIAADNMSIQPPITSTLTDLSKLEIPYCYVTPATNSVFQLNTAKMNIGVAIENAIQYINLENYYNKNVLDSSFIKKDTEHVYIGLSSKANSKLHLFGDSQSKKIGIEMSNPAKDNTTEYCGYVGLNYDGVPQGSAMPTLTVHNEYSIQLDSSDGNIEVRTPKTFDISVGTANIDVSSFDAYASMLFRMKSTDRTEIDTSVFELNINSSTYVKANRNGIDINSGNLKLFGTTLQNTNQINDDKSRVLVLEHDKNEMNWKVSPVLSIISSLQTTNGLYNTSVNYNMSDFKDTSCRVKYLTFYGYSEENITVNEEILQTTTVDASIGIRYLKSGDVKQQLVFKGTDDSSHQVLRYQKDPFISLKRFGTPDNAYDILMKYDTDHPTDEYIPVVFNNSSVFTRKVDLQIDDTDSNSNERYYILGATQNNITTINNENGREGSLHRTTNIFFNKDNIYANSYYATSDERLKDNISNVSDSDSIPHVVSFNWKGNGKKSYGFIAQDLEKQGLSELVETDDNGFKRVDYNSALSLAVAHLQRQNDELKAQVAYLMDLVKKNNL